ncbi:MAG: helix-turn-helix transcriptional regulator [Nocardioidaceae bacterium]|nr:helix-turn-helix transcriptional regulator [Nocardioidaceae bacterium]
METTLAELVKSIDPAILGRRLRVARTAAGLTQTEAAGGDVSTAYISRIEAGERRPDLTLLGNLAARLGTTVDELLTGISRDRRAELMLELDYAELELSSGNGGAALARADSILAALADAGVAEIERPARFVRAYALESTGDLDAAIAAFETLTALPPHDLAWVRGLIALSRCYRESGDFAMAIDVGERAGTTIEEHGLSGLTESMQLTLTVAAAYFERGDATHAIRLCKQTITRAEELGSATARGSAYWNASMMASRQGSIREALSMARQAIDLFEQDSDTRNLARLRTELANMQLRQDPPEAAEAKQTLELASRELDWSSASTLDKAENQLALARANLLLGDPVTAAELAGSSYDIAMDQAPLAASEALVLQGQIAAIEDRTDEARATYREAILLLSGVGADRRVAELWFELGGLLQDVGEIAAALDAFRRSAASTGITPSIPLHQAMARAQDRPGARTLHAVPTM